MKKLRQESITTAVGTIAAGSLVFITDKLGDLVVSVFSEDGLTWRKALLLILLLFLVFVVSIGLQSLFSIIKIIKRRITGETRIEELRRRIEETRLRIFSNLDNLRANREIFNSKIDSAREDILELRPNDNNFQNRKKEAASKVLELKDIYQRNFYDLERLVAQTYEDIDDAERIYLESEAWASNAAEEFFRE